MVWYALPDGTVEFFNKRWLEYTGLTVECMRTAGVKGVVHPDELPETFARWHEALATGKPYEMEYRLRCIADGRYRWFLARSYPVVDETGTIRAWVGSATDIDDQKHVRQNLAFVLEAVDAFAGSLDERDICAKLAQLAVPRFADWCCVTLHQPPGTPHVVVAAHREPGLAAEMESFRLAHASRIQSPAELERLSAGPVLMRPADARGLADAAGAAALPSSGLEVHSSMVLPIKTSTGELYGSVMMVLAESRREFSASDLAVAERVVGRAAAALHTAKAFDAERALAVRLRFINKVSSTIFESLDVFASLGRLLEIIVAEIGDFARIALIEGDGLRTVAAAHRDPTQRVAVARLVDQRWYVEGEEEAMLARLREHRPFVRTGSELESSLRSVKSYLRADLASLRLTSEVVTPLYAGTTTYGALVVYGAEGQDPIGRSDVPVFVEVAHRISLGIEMTHSFERERRIAATMQQAALPAILPHVAGARFEGVYSPASEEGAVGGDWYDALELDDGSILISVGDVAGRGIRAAAVMGKIRHAIGALPLHERDPAKILDDVDWILRHRNYDALVTAFVGIIAPDRRTIRFANAGHPYPLVRRGAELFELRAPGLPIGMRTMSPTEPSSTADIEGLDLLLLYTDGLVEWGREYSRGEARLREIMSSEAVLHAPSRANLIHDYCLRGDSPDDVAILAVSFLDEEGWTFEADDARAAHDARSAFTAYLQTRMPDDRAIASAEMVFGELVANVARHAPGPVSVEVQWEDGVPVVHVIDRGPAFRFESDLPADPLSEDGRGLYIVGRAAGEVRVERLEGFGNHVSVRLPVV